MTSRARCAARATAALLLAAALTGTALLTTDTASAKRRHHRLMKVRYGTRPLRPHTRGTDVRVLQRNLTRLKQRTAADGAYGRGTYKSLRRFERGRRWHVDGWAGRQELAAIGYLVGEQKARRLARIQANTAQILPDGTASVPANAPRPVRKAINAANRIHTKPYVWGGGHGNWESNGYDCSGAVSYVLHAAGLLPYPMASGALRHWGYPGSGQWITVYANKSHAWMTVAGLRFDTSSVGESWNQGSGPRWRATMRSGAGYAVRYSPGL